ncbi:UNVERIFIED_CONTAM: hypothetical protein Slati_1269500 [Sesamum latifolium]|uniref:Reverse transcriptase n=1 Tax=Sesamum latifolium TaxID=2727402 RepID=A0AAW2XFT9_9LAMI
MVERQNDAENHNRGTPFYMIYGSEAMIPVDIGSMMLRAGHYDQKENEVQRYLDLAYNKKVKPRQLQVEDLVLKKVEVSKHVGKLDANWEGPFKVTKICEKESYRLQMMDGNELPNPGISKF